LIPITWPDLSAVSDVLASLVARVDVRAVLMNHDVCTVMREV
jgi:hypothetical protein